MTTYPRFTAGLPEEGLTGLPGPMSIGTQAGPVVVLKFRRADIADALAQKGETVDTEFILKGGFDDGTAPTSYLYDFETTDTITKIVSEPQKQTADVSEPTAPPPPPPPDAATMATIKAVKRSKHRIHHKDSEASKSPRIAHRGFVS